ncbi:UbiD family decarboxylase [bacterium]|nr:MAG: UbiD family decarboxylase [bacterium]
MHYRSLESCVTDLEKKGQLIRVKEEVDPCLEMAEIQRRVYQVQGPALLFTNVKGSRFRCVSNLFGTMARTRFIFRSSLESVKKLVELKIDPTIAMKHPFRYWSVPLTALKTIPQKRFRSHFESCKIQDLPQIQSWPDDGGAFVTLPQVYTEHPDFPGTRLSNLGMYRIQLSGNEYKPNEEIGLHYQIHRSIGVHHAAAIRRGEKLKVSIFIGGPPALSVAAVMPLPEGLSELMFAGVLGGRRFRYFRDPKGFLVAADADFCITGTIDPNETKPEGPFGDHLGYYSLRHAFPFLKVENVYHKPNAIWAFTVVGRPPQEDTSFGDLIHDITGPIIPTVIPGLHAVNAVDAAGVHPLLLAIGSERYVPFEERRPQEILTIANAILGQGQLSLAKYLFITAKEDNPELDIHHVEEFFTHVLERVDWKTDLHFQTRTTMDTLDYTGTAVNEGSKLVIAAAGKIRRKLPVKLPPGFTLPEGFKDPKAVIPGVLSVTAKPISSKSEGESEREKFCVYCSKSGIFDGFPLIVLCDDSNFAAQNLNNFLWVTFTRSNPASDVSGAGAFIEDKHWGCNGPLVIDARIKPHHAPPLIEDPEITRRVDQFGLKGRSLHGII